MGAGKILDELVEDSEFLVVGAGGFDFGGGVDVGKVGEMLGEGAWGLG